MCVKAVSRANQFRPKFGEIKNLSVEDNPCGAISVGHRLMAAGRINNTQPIEGKSDIAVPVNAIVVGAAMYRKLPHARKQPLVNSTVPIIIKYPIYATHKPILGLHRAYLRMPLI